MQTAAPGLPALVTTTIQAAQANGLLPNILVPVINELDDVSGSYAGDQRPAYDAFVKNGGTLWTYQSCMSHGCAFGGDPSQSGWPSYMIDASGGRNRAMQWVDFNERVTGELYYETVNAYEGGDPWADQYRFGGNGDGTLFYPGEPSKIGGQTEIPVASLRLKLIRQGMEDYEYLAKVSALGDPAFAAAQAATVAKDPHSVSSDPQLFHAARAALGARILPAHGSRAPHGRRRARPGGCNLGRGKPGRGRRGGEPVLERPPPRGAGQGDARRLLALRRRDRRSALHGRVRRTRAEGRARERRPAGRRAGRRLSDRRGIPLALGLARRAPAPLRFEAPPPAVTRSRSIERCGQVRRESFWSVVQRRREPERNRTFVR